MRANISRARALYGDGLPGVMLLAPRCRLPILVAGRLCLAILGRIEANGYDVFTRRARTTRYERVTALVHASGTLFPAPWRTPLRPLGAMVFRWTAPTEGASG